MVSLHVNVCGRCSPRTQLPPPEREALYFRDRHLSCSALYLAYPTAVKQALAILSRERVATLTGFRFAGVFEAGTSRTCCWCVSRDALCVVGCPPMTGSCTSNYCTRSASCWWGLLYADTGYAGELTIVLRKVALVFGRCVWRQIGP